MAGYNRRSNKRADITKQIDNNMLGRYMNEGPHTATIQSVSVVYKPESDTVNSFTMDLENSFGETHRENVFLWSMSEEDISIQLKQLLASSMETPRQIYDMTSAINDFDWSVLDQLVGKEVGVNLNRSSGYRVSRSGEGYSAVGTSSGEIYGTYESVSELRSDMKDRDIPRSYVRVNEYYRTGEQNETNKRQSFRDFASRKPQPTGTNSTGNVGEKRARPVSARKRFF